MALAQEALFCSAPNTERGMASVLSVDSKGKLLVYPSGHSVVMRIVQNPTDIKLYTQHTAPVTVAKLSPSTYYCASGDRGGNVRIWATNNEDLTLKLETRPVTGPVRDIAWSPDSQRVVVVGDSKERFVSAFLFDTGATVGEFSGHSKQVISCDFKPSRPFRIATGSEDMQVNFYEGPPFKFTKSFKEHTNYVNCVRYRPDGAVLLSVGSDKKAYLFDGKTGESVGELKVDHSGSIYSCSWAADGKKVLTTSADKTCKLWDMDSSSLICTFTFEDTTVDYMQVGGAVAGEQLLSLSLNGDLNYLDARNPTAPSRIIRGHSHPITCLVCDADNVFYTASTDGVILQWLPDGDSHRITGKGHTSAINTLALVGGRLVSCGMDSLAITTNPKTLTFGDATPLQGGATCCCVLPGTPTLLVGTTSHVLILKEGNVLFTEAAPYGALAIACSATDVAVGGKDKNVYIFHFDNETLLLAQKLPGHGGAVHALAYSSDGTQLASGCAGRDLFVWTCGKEYQVRHTLSYHASTIKGLHFSPSSQYLVSAGLDCQLIVWDLEAGTKAVTRGHDGGCSAVAFLGHNKVVSVGQDACIRLWALSD
eukprot:NODE_719_length_1920_cov_94.894032_g667_i0.p1 GENE.NODE_719_length_1920_cov_94.894032_g667_i0~~NODE_719_length_1920_cov_94.894032_g667_i0.p1  ORF type:complete len:608 (+),score=143.56 NODE_719_length_1920_cov_94.894032_g667_i0:44-1825(+)